MTTAKKKQNYTNWLETQCAEILTWAGYEPHTTFHRYRYPLIGNHQAWIRLEDRLNFQRKGRTPNANDEFDQDKKHVLDIIIYSSRDRSKIKLVKTNMHTVVLWHNSSCALTPSDEQEWISKLEPIDGSIASIDFEQTMDDTAIDLQPAISIMEDSCNMNAAIISSELPPVSKSKTKRQKVKLFGNSSNDEPKIVDQLSILFGGENGLSDIISLYQEDYVKRIMIESGAIIYNRELLPSDPPDGYYLCDAKCLSNLKQRFRDATQIFATQDIFDASDKETYILLVVEAKISMSSLQGVFLNKNNYYISNIIPEPIRHLIIVDGGIESHGWMFFLNLVNIGSPDRCAFIKEATYEIICEIAQKLKSNLTHVVHLPHFSSETFRQEPLTEAGMKLLHELHNAREHIKTCSKKTMKSILYKRIFRYLDIYMSKNPVKEPPLKIYDNILLDSATKNNNTLLNILEEQVLNFGYEAYKKTKECNSSSNIQMPKWLCQHVENVLIERQNKMKKKRSNLNNNKINIDSIEANITMVEESVGPISIECDEIALIMDN